MIGTIVSSKPPKDSSLFQLLIDVGVGGVASTCRGVFLSPAAGPKKWSHICNHTWNAVNEFEYNLSHNHDGAQLRTRQALAR